MDLYISILHFFLNKLPKEGNSFLKYSVIEITLITL